MSLEHVDPIDLVCPSVLLQYKLEVVCCFFCILAHIDFMEFFLILEFLACNLYTCKYHLKDP